MSDELLNTIQKLNRRNHDLAGFDQDAPDTGSDPLVYSRMLRDFEIGLSEEIRVRVDKVLSRFTMELRRLAAETMSMAGKSQAFHGDLAVTQEIEYSEGGSSSLGHDVSEIQIRELSESMESLRKSVEAGELGGALLEQQLETLARNTARDIEEGFELLSVKLSGAGLGESGDAPIQLPEVALAQIREQLETITKLLEDAPVSAGNASPDVPATDSPPMALDNTKILERFADLQGSLAEINSKLRKLQEQPGQSPNSGANDESEGSPPPPADVAGFEQALERLESTLESSLKSSHAELGEKLGEKLDGLSSDLLNSGDTPVDDGSAAESLELVKALRRDFSLLVHTINAHLEEQSQFAEEFMKIRQDLADPTEMASEIVTRILDAIGDRPPSGNGDDQNPGAASLSSAPEVLEMLENLEKRLTENLSQPARAPEAMTVELRESEERLLASIGMEIRSALAELPSVPAESPEGSMLERLEAIQGQLGTGLDRVLSGIQEVAAGIATAPTDSAAAPDSGATLERLEAAMSDLEQLKALPERIASILGAADESNQFGINAAVKDATETIVSRIAELVQ